MRTVFICLLLLLTVGVAFAGDGQDLVPRHLHAKDIVGLISFGALGAMLFWLCASRAVATHLTRSSTQPPGDTAMKPILSRLGRAALLLLPALALAHPGAGMSHAHDAFLTGLLHPLTGIDHLAAMLALGSGARWPCARSGWRPRPSC